jgi:aminoglycoside 6'-N-acetyltransferase I
MCREVMRPIHVRPAQPGDIADWLRMRVALWPEGSAREHAAEIEQYFARALTNPLEVLLAIDETGKTIGFAELSIRNYAEDCDTDRVAYLEGWYVDAARRRRGVGRALVVAAEAWARSQGCTEFGSDALLDDKTSEAAHLALGFEETEQIRCFKKNL